MKVIAYNSNIHRKTIKEIFANDCVNINYTRECRLGAYGISFYIFDIKVNWRKFTKKTPQQKYC